MVGKKPKLTFEQAEHSRATALKRRELRAQLKSIPAQLRELRAEKERVESKARELRARRRALQSQLRQLPSGAELARLYDCSVQTIDKCVRGASKHHEQERRARAANN